SRGAGRCRWCSPATDSSRTARRPRCRCSAWARPGPAGTRCRRSNTSAARRRRTSGRAWLPRDRSTSVVSVVQWARGKLPERAAQPHGAENRLRFPERPLPPVLLEVATVPAIGERLDLRQRNERAAGDAVTRAPSLDVGLFAEREHGGAPAHDVVPGGGGGRG